MERIMVGKFNLGSSCSSHTKDSCSIFKTFLIFLNGLLEILFTNSAGIRGEKIVMEFAARLWSPFVGKLLVIILGCSWTEYGYYNNIYMYSFISYCKYVLFIIVPTDLK